MNENNVMIAEAYFKAFNNANIESIAQYLHPEVRYIAPFGELSGKEAVLAAATRFHGIVKKLTVRETVESGNKVMLIYDLLFGEASTASTAAVYLEFQDKLIVRMELFYDTRPFVK